MRAFTYINRVDISLMEPTHVPIWKQAIWKQRKEHEFRQRQQLITRKGEPGAPEPRISIYKSTFWVSYLPEIKSDVLIAANI